MWDHIFFLGNRVFAPNFTRVYLLREGEGPQTNQDTTLPSGWWFVFLNIFFHIYIYIYWKCHHPNWLITHIFQRGRLKPPTSHEFPIFEVDKSEPAGPGAPQGPCVPEALRVATRAWCTKRNRSRSRCGDSQRIFGFSMWWPGIMQLWPFTSYKYL